jgi:DNA-binding HxlR family transcriptional regulator
MLDNINFRSTCPVSSVMDIIGDKWSLIIIRDLFLDRNTYSEFLKSPEGIATNILVDRLKKLTSYGLISYFKKPNDKKVKVYYLTDLGIDLYPIICEMTIWHNKHLKFREMHPLGVDQITRIENKGLTCEISDTVEDYQKRRKALLETATL